MNEIKLFSDQEDLTVKITNDDILNVTGSVGSGKSTLGKKYSNDDNYIVIGLDSLYNNFDIDTLNDDVLELREKLKEKNGEELDTEEMTYYNDIVDFIKSKNKKGIIEGGHLMHMQNISDFKGTVIVKRTARFKCWLRSSKRDYNNPVWRKGLNRLGLIKRWFHCYGRRFHHIFRQKYVEEFILKLKNYEKLERND